jgi:hypothetical protein
MNDQPSRSAPEANPTDPYCGNCGYSLKDLTDSTRCPECGKPVVEVLMRPGFGQFRGKRYQSKTTLFGLPVIDIAIGPHGAEPRGRARGIIAIGDLASGWLAIGGLARGIVAIGGLAIGIFPFGGLAIGLLTAFGGLAVSLGIANGGLSLATISNGGLAIGWAAQGGLAAGNIARGALAFTKSSPHNFAQLRWLLGNFPAKNALDPLRPLLFTLLPTISCAALICVLAVIQLWLHKERPPKTN